MKTSSAQSMDFSNNHLWQRRSNQNRAVSQGVKILFGSAAAISILTNLGIVATLIFETIGFFKEVPFLRFITDTQWTPLFVKPHMAYSYFIGRLQETEDVFSRPVGMGLQKIVVCPSNSLQCRLGRLSVNLVLG